MVIQTRELESDNADVRRANCVIYTNHGLFGAPLLSCALLRKI